MKFRKNQIVIITTVNRGLGPSVFRRKPSQTQVWVGLVYGPSPIGGDLWLVKKPGKSGVGRSGSAVYTVPENEMRLVTEEDRNGQV